MGVILTTYIGPGQAVPANMNIVTAGFWQVYRAITQIWKLKQSLMYLIGYFLLGDSLNTTVTVIATLQNSIIEYNTLQLTYLYLVGIAAQGVGIYSFWYVQKTFGFSTKTMFNTVAIGIILLDGWGMIGIWTQKFGFHHLWEVWVYQTFYGLFVCPWYSYSQIMVSATFMNILSLCNYLLQPDFGSNTQRQGVSILLTFLDNRQDLVFHRAHCQLGHHRRLAHEQQQLAFLLSFRAELSQLRIAAICRSGQEPERTSGVLGGRKAGQREKSGIGLGVELLFAGKRGCRMPQRELGKRSLSLETQIR
jgi:Vacuole effluxer Atg22 like